MQQRQPKPALHVHNAPPELVAWVDGVAKREERSRNTTLIRLLRGLMLEEQQRAKVEAEKASS